MLQLRLQRKRLLKRQRVATKRTSRRKRASVSAGIHKLMRQYKSSGAISTSRATYRPRSLEAAQKQAAAIEYGRHGIGRAGRRRQKRRAA